MIKAINKEALRNNQTKENLELALADMLNGIREDWELSISDIAAILSMPEGTVKGWLKPNSHVSLSSVLDHNTQAIIDFIDVYNMIASFFVKKSDQIQWFKAPSNRFFGKSPMEMISEAPHNLATARYLIKGMLNP
ncbi:MAG: hypothetical protein JNL11_14995 [Bdellovibrionaceae bacterium]|nr:hypothetical protein [Pseudobdellovibrionaceae bacterium]